MPENGVAVIGRMLYWGLSAGVYLGREGHGLAAAGLRFSTSGLGGAVSARGQARQGAESPL